MTPEEIELSLSWQPNKGNVSEVGEHGFKHLKENLGTLYVPHFLCILFHYIFAALNIRVMTPQVVLIIQ
jgi:hypothetical protein